MHRQAFRENAYVFGYKPLHIWRWHGDRKLLQALSSVTSASAPTAEDTHRHCATSSASCTPYRGRARVNTSLLLLRILGFLSDVEGGCVRCVCGRGWGGAHGRGGRASSETTSSTPLLPWDPYHEARLLPGILSSTGYSETTFAL